MDANDRLKATKATLSKYRVLVVEDSDAARSSYTEALRKAGFLVDDARSLEEAMNMLDDRTYHVALVDIMLKGEHDKENRDGQKVLNAINESRREVRVGGKRLIGGTRSIALTGLDSAQEVFELGQKYGTNEFIDKSKHIFDLLDQIVPRVEQEAKKAHLDRYGDKGAIPFLAGPGNEGSWVDQCLAVLMIKGGYPALESFFSSLCDPIAPLVPQADGSTPTTVSKAIGVVMGTLWSKVLALPILLVAGRTEFITAQLDGPKFPALKSDLLLTMHSAHNLTGVTVELKDRMRSDFQSEFR